MANRYNKRLYNYLVNTYGLSKEIIRETMNQRIEAVLTKSLQDLMKTNEFKNILLDSVTNIMKNGIKGTHFWKKINFDDYLKDVISDKVEQTVMAEMRKKYSIELKAIRKEDGVISLPRKAKK